MDSAVLTLDELRLLFEATLSPSKETASQAHNRLLQLANHNPRNPQHSLFFENLCLLLLNAQVSEDTKIAAAIFLKNLVKQHWNNGDDTGISESNKAFIRSHSLKLLLSVPTTDGSGDSGVPLSSTSVIPGVKSKRRVQSQLSEAVAIISRHEFPKIWDGLLQELIQVLIWNDEVRNADNVVNGLRDNLIDTPQYLDAVKTITKNALMNVAVWNLISQLLGRYKGLGVVLDMETATDLKLILSQLCDTLLKNFQFYLSKIELLSPAGTNSGLQLALKIRDPNNTSKTLDEILNPKTAEAPKQLVHVLDTHLDYYFYACCNSMLSLLECFHCLNALDLPEFFEDNVANFMNIMIKLLGSSFDFEYFLRFDKIETQYHCVEHGGILESIKAKTIDIFTLYSDRYQEVFEPYVGTCFKLVCELLVQVDCSERNDHIVISGMKFLNSLAQTNYSCAGAAQKPFEDKVLMDEMCRKIILPNIYLRDVDIEAIDEDPQEFIRKDMEGTDSNSRRQTAISLTKGLVKVSPKITSGALLEYVRYLCVTPSSNPLNSARMKDTCAALVIGLPKGIAGSMVDNIPNSCLPDAVVTETFIQKFFAEQLLNELQSEQSHILCIAAALKFATVFRNNMPSEILSKVIELASNQLRNPDPVVHTYAANCIDKLLQVREKDQISTISTSAQAPITRKHAPTVVQFATVKVGLVSAVEELLKVIESKRGIPENEYLMRCLFRICQFCIGQMNDIFVPILTRLINILKIVASNPSNPVHSHYLFETIALICRSCSNSPVISQCQTLLLPVLSHMVQQEQHEFTPYGFQVLGLLLDLLKDSESIPLYVDIFNFVMQPYNWRQSKANVPGLVRLIESYFRKYSLFSDLLMKNMGQVWERFQFCLNHSRLIWSGAFPLLMAIIRYLPFQYYQNDFKTLLTVILKKVNQTNTDSLRRSVTLFLATCVCRIPNGAKVLVESLESIQSGLTCTFMKMVYLRAAENIADPTEEKLIIFATAKLLACQELQSNRELVGPALIILAAKLENALSKLPSLDSTNNELDEIGNMPAIIEDEYDSVYACLSTADLSSKDVLSDISDVEQQTKSYLREIAHLIKQECLNGCQIDKVVKFIEL